MYLIGLKSAANCFGTACCSRFSCLNLSSAENAIMGRTFNNLLVKPAVGVNQLLGRNQGITLGTHTWVSVKPDDQKEDELWLNNQSTGNKQSPQYLLLLGCYQNRDFSLNCSHVRKFGKMAMRLHWRATHQTQKWGWFQFIHDEGPY